MKLGLGRTVKFAPILPTHSAFRPRRSCGYSALARPVTELNCSTQCPRYYIPTRLLQLDLYSSPIHSSQTPYLFPRARRRFGTSAIVQHNALTPPKPGEELKVTFIDKEGDEHQCTVAQGDNLLDIAQSEDLDMEGACGGSCACSTCHVIVESDDMYDKMPEPDDDENDMLDLAFGLTETSRLGCQVKMTPQIDGLRVRLPSMTRNLQASDFSGAKK